VSFLNYFVNPPGLKEYDPETFSQKMNEEGSKVVDVRTDGEYSRSRIEPSVHFPLRTLPGATEKLDKTGKILLVCATGHRSRAAASILLKEGFQDVSHLKGGMLAWRKYKKNTP